MKHRENYFPKKGAVDEYTEELQGVFDESRQSMRSMPGTLTSQPITSLLI
jgi:hypothetical protein